MASATVEAAPRQSAEAHDVFVVRLAAVHQTRRRVAVEGMDGFCASDATTKAQASCELAAPGPCGQPHSHRRARPRRRWPMAKDDLTGQVGCQNMTWQIKSGGGA
jgi:hypothetical protein